MYIDDDGFYDMDFELITNDKVRIGDSEIYIELGNSITIGDLTIKTDLSDILYDGESFKTKDDAYLTHDGITFKDVEKCVEDANDCEFTVGVPNTDEAIEATISIAVDGVIIPGEVEPVTPIDQKPKPPVVVDKCKDITCAGDEECKEGICEKKETPFKPGPEPEPEPVEPEPTEPEPITPTEPKGLTWLWWLIGLIVIVALGYYFFLKKK